MKLTTKLLTRSFIYLILAVAAVVCLYPFYVMVISSLRDLSSIFDAYWPPTHLTTQAYRDIFTSNQDIRVTDNVILNFEVPFTRHFFNSLLVSVLRTFLTVTLCAMAGFAFSKYRFPGKNALFILVLFTMMIPPAVTLIPLFYVMRFLGWINTYQALIVPGLASAFGVFWMRQYMQSIPDELLDQGRIDGCTAFGLFLRIILPLSRPGLGILAILIFVGSWGDFLWPLIVLQSQELFTIPVFLSSMNGAVSQSNPLTMAGSVLATLPIIIIYLIFRRQLIDGLIVGAIK